MPRLDWLLLMPCLLLTFLGLMMVASSSMHIALASNFSAGHYFFHQLIYFLFSLLLTPLVISKDIFWFRKHALMIFAVLLLALVLVLVPGIGHKVNGSARWLSFGIVKVQVSEFMKLAAVLYISDLLLRKQRLLANSYRVHLELLVIWLILALLLLFEPDFGAFVVIFLTTSCIWFLVGCRLRYLLLALFSGILSIAAMVWLAPYRLARLKTFFHPWQHAYDSGYQLTQALIAFGRGGVFGKGLGAGLQKQFYLPEAHTDFLYAVLCEELGLVAGLLVIVLFFIVVARCMFIAKRAYNLGARYHALICYGVAVWLSLQVTINISVNMGLLPTKGLTLPFMSYGGSSLLFSMLAVALVMRVSYELQQKPNMYLKTVSDWRRL